MSDGNWKELNLEAINAMPRDTDYRIGVWSTDSYPDFEMALNQGGMYQLKETISGRDAIYTVIDGINTTQECMDGAMPLRIVYRIHDVGRGSLP